MDDMSARAIALLEELLDEKISGEDAFADLDIDSLTMLEWVFALEQEFDLALDDGAVEQVDRSHTVAQVAAGLLS